MTDISSYDLIINGVVTWRHGRHSGAHSGQVITRTSENTRETT